MEQEHQKPFKVSRPAALDGYRIIDDHCHVQPSLLKVLLECFDWSTLWDEQYFAFELHQVS